MKFYKLLILLVLSPLLLIHTHVSHAEPDIDSLWDSDDLNVLSPEYVEIVQLRRRPYIRAYWKEFPSLRVCADSGVRLQRMQTAVHMWRRLGYSLGSIYWDDGSAICTKGGINGEIIILLVTNNTPIGNNIAITRTYYDKESRVIQKAQIFVLGGYSNDSRILEHEIGHALGWGHFNRSLHIMNSHYPDTGHDIFGVRYTDYEKNIKKFSSELD
tara:strand:- start:357 stop:998 length:642 start_codon:yes stop_codon:yes gene_type:complete